MPPPACAGRRGRRVRRASGRDRRGPMRELGTTARARMPGAGDAERRRGRRRRGRRARGRRDGRAPRPRRPRRRAARALAGATAGARAACSPRRQRSRELRHAGLDADDAGAGRAADPRDARGDAGRGRTAFRLTYGAETTATPAVGFDRSALDPALLDLAAACRRGRPARRGGDGRRAGRSPSGATVTAEPNGDPAAASVAARVVVGADGPRSIVAEAAGVVRPPVLAPRVGLTWHVADEPRRPGRATHGWSCSAAARTAASRRCPAAA